MYRLTRKLMVFEVGRKIDRLKFVGRETRMEWQVDGTARRDLEREEKKLGQHRQYSGQTTKLRRTMIGGGEHSTIERRHTHTHQTQPTDTDEHMHKRQAKKLAQRSTMNNPCCISRCEALCAESFNQAKSQKQVPAQWEPSQDCT